MKKFGDAVWIYQLKQLSFITQQRRYFLQCIRDGNPHCAKSGGCL